jgi:type IV secretory pathway VirD2 relaxase
MPKRDDNDVRPRSARRRAEASDSKFVTQVLRLAGPRLGRGLGGKRGPGRLGRGQVAALAGIRSPGPRSRRVIVKARLVVQPGRLTPSTIRHARYLQRELPGEPGNLPAYGPGTDPADLDAFAARCAGDRHQFRFIVSPEDGAELGDLQPYTRALMSQVERDLQTRLEWVAVDHADTDNPHTHVLLRGKTADGQDLVIGRDYISRGMRLRAQEIATDFLGPRTDLEIEATRVRELEADRMTPLDRTLQREAVDGVLDLRQTPATTLARQAKAAKLGRLTHLARLRLAAELRPGVWQLQPDAEAMLHAIGEREDMLRVLHRTLGATGNDAAIYDQARSLPVTGRIAARGMADELREQGYLAVAGTDGRGHYMRLSSKANLKDYPVGAILTVRGPKVVLESTLPLDRQMRALGATWLDSQLVAGTTSEMAMRGFGAEVRSALAVRTEFLIEQGLASREDAQLRIAKDLLPTLRSRELATVGARLAAETGMTYRPVQEGQRASGIYRQAVALVSGKYAMLADGVGFSLVPWRPDLERSIHRGVGMPGPRRGIQR